MSNTKFVDIKFLKHKESIRFLKYCIVGIIGMVINTIILVFLTNLGSYYIFSSVVAGEISILSNFAINDHWTFNELIVIGKSHTYFMRAIHYNWTRLSMIFSNALILYLLTRFLSINYVISNIIAMGTGIVWGYFSAMKIVWRK